MHLATSLVVIALAAAQSPDLTPPIGLLSFGLRQGTGFMVSECRAVTNKHVLPRRAKIGARGNMLIGGKKRRVTVEAIGDHPNPTARQVTRAGDWAVLRLDECVDSTSGFFELLADPLLATPYFHFAVPQAEGFAAGRRPLRTFGPCPTVAVLPDGTVEYACRVHHGQSGSPVYVRKPSGQLLALAIVSAGEQTAGGHTFAAPVEEISRHLRGDKTTPIGPFRTRPSKMEETRSAFR